MWFYITSAGFANAREYWRNDAAQNSACLMLTQVTECTDRSAKARALRVGSQSQVAGRLFNWSHGRDSRQCDSVSARSTRDGTRVPALRCADRCLADRPHPLGLLQYPRGALGHRGLQECDSGNHRPASASQGARVSFLVRRSLPLSRALYKAIFHC